MKVRVTNLQRFCLNDGPGIRTTVFLKGCNLHCPWCANPENINYEKQEYVLKEKSGIYGIDYDIQKLFNELIKDKQYFDINNGGVTFSGGEALLQAPCLIPLLKKLKDYNINICFETALIVPSELLELVIPFVDYFIVDIKILDEDKVKSILGGILDLYYKNLDILYKENKILNFRIPLIKEYTMNNKNLEKILVLLKKYNGIKVEIFKVHNLAENKYKSLGIEINKYEDISDDEILEVYNLFKSKDINVEIIKV